MTRSYKSKEKLMLKTILLLSFILILNQSIFAQGVWDGGGTDDNWSTAANWDNDVVPNGIAVTIDDNTLRSNTIVDAGFTNSITSLTIGTTNTMSVTLQTGLTVTGNVTVNANGSFSGTSATTLTMGGNLTVNSGATFPGIANVTFNGGGTQTITGSFASFMQFFNLTITGASTVLDNNLGSALAQITVNGTMTISSEAQLQAGARQYNFASTAGGTVLNITNTATDPIIEETSTFNVSTGVAVTLSSAMNVEFNNLTHSPTAGEAQLTFSGNNTFTIQNTFTVDEASTGIVQGGTTTIAYSSGNLVYSTDRNLTVGIEWPSSSPPDAVSISGTATITLSTDADRSLSGSFTLSAGTLSLGSNVDLTAGTTSGTLTINGGTLTATSTNTITASDGMTISSGTLTCDGTVTIDDGETFTLSGGTFNNASGTLVITGGAIFAKGAGAFTVGTTLTYGATSTLQYTTGQTAGDEWPVSGGPPNVTIQSGTVTQSSDRTISDNLTLEAGTELNLGSANLITQGNATLYHLSNINTTGTARVDGDLTISGDGTIGSATGGTLDMNGGVDQDVTLDGDIQLFNFTVNKTNAAEVVVTASAGSAIKFWDNATAKVLRVQDGVLSFGVNASITDGSGGTINDNNVTLQIDGTGTFRTGGINITGFSNYTLADNSTIDFSGSDAEDIPADTYGNITVSNIHALGASLTGNIDLNTNSTITVSSGSRLNLAGYLFSSHGGSDVLAGGGTLYTDGTDITGFSSYTFSGSLILNGSSARTVPGLSLTNMTVNNGAGVTLGGNVSVSNTLTLTNGLVTTGANTLTIGSGGNISGASSSRYIVGNLARTFTAGSSTKSYPLGESGGTYRLVELTGSGTGTATGSIVTSDAAIITATLGGSLAKVSSIRYFQFSNSTSALTITEVNNFRVNSDDNVGSLNPNNSLRLATTVGTGLTWNERTLTSAPNTTSLPVNITTTTFSEGVGATEVLYVALATTSTADNSLPVSLTSFTANAEFSKITLNWQTESEIDNQGFNIYRATGTNPENWITINQELIPGAGNTSARTEYAFVDQSVHSGETYYYQLESISYNGVRELFIESTVTVVAPVPTKFVLLNNYPNPFNPVTNLKFQLPEQSEVTVIIYDIQGHLVKKLLSKLIYSAGEHVVQWNATDQFGIQVSTGIYFYQFIASNFHKYGKMMLIK